ncbi:MAG: HAMP domain-containing sensor histidine kinase [Phycisphaeraceae bacterium]
MLLEELDSSITDRVARLGALTGAPGLSARAAEHARDRYLIADEHGQIVARMPTNVARTWSPRVTRRSFTIISEGQRMRTLTLEAAVPTGELAGATRQLNVVYSAPADNFDRTLTRLALALLAGGLVAGLLAAGVVGAVARRALKPLRDATEVIRSIDVHGLDRRIEADPLPPELRPVATTLNEMLTALQVAFEQRRQFLADASHELRTPVAAMLTALEVALSRPRSESELRDTLQRCLGNVNNLRQLIEHLLEQVRSDHAANEELSSELHLASWIEEVISQVAPLANLGRVRVEAWCDPQLRIATQQHRLHSIVVNLVSNAIEHNCAGGWVHVEVSDVDGDLVISVSDNGPGIPAEHQSRVFDPFYRVSSSRDSQKGHLGLGLYLVKSHARALGGRHELASDPEHGTTVRIILPGSVLNPGAQSPSAPVAVSALE